MESLGQIYNLLLLKIHVCPQNFFLNTVVPPGHICTFGPWQRHQFVSTQNVPKVVKVNPKVTAKPLQKETGFSSREGSLNTDLMRTDIINIQRFVQMVETTHNHWAWSHIKIKISQRHVHEIYQRQGNHFITVIHLVQVTQKRI